MAKYNVMIQLFAKCKTRLSRRVIRLQLSSFANISLFEEKNRLTFSDMSRLIPDQRDQKISMKQSNYYIFMEMKVYFFIQIPSYLSF